MGYSADACDAFAIQENISFSIPASHPSPSDLMALLFNIKLAILLAMDPEASEGASLIWRAEFTHPDHLPVGTSISKSSQSQRGEIPPQLFSWEENAL